MAYVKIESIRKSFGTEPALRGIDLEVPEHRMTVILGPSGCGKTTLLRILAGLEDPDGGSVTQNGEVVSDGHRRIPPEKRNLGMVFQDSLLWPHMSVRSNIAFPLGRGRTKDPRVEEAARAAEIEGFLSRYPSELSGGEQRRVSIARAIVAKPKLLLLDEPLSGLDANLRVRLLTTIRRIQRELGLTAVYVTHDQDEALGIGDLLVVMRAGSILQIGSPEEVYQQPSTAFVAGFVGLSTLLEGEAADGRVETPFGSFPAGEGDAGRVFLAVRPESVRFTEEEGVEGTIVTSSFRGDRWVVEVEVLERRVLAFSAVDRQPGQPVRVMLDPVPVSVRSDGRQS